jgi:glycosyltransferase involved in cell wall biosynthesis
MTKEVVFVSDYFLNEIRGGAEFCNDALIRLLQKQYSVKLLKSQFVSPETIEENKDCFFIVANFFLLSEESKKALANKVYVIFEHDHKYIHSNNPSLFSNFLAPESQLINKEFYKNALATICQSKKHSEVVQKNTLLNNVVNMGGNIWTDHQFKTLEKNLDAHKNIEFAILRSQNKNKGMPAAVDFCNTHGLDFEYLEHQPYEQFIENLSRVKNLVFFPQWLESYNRLSVEARILGCRLVTNNLLGAASEDYFKLKGRPLLEHLIGNNDILFERWKKMINDQKVEYIKPIKLPKVTVFCPIYNAEKYIENFLLDIKKQTFFNSCELIIINANSPQNEEKYIIPFMEQNSNVIYKKLDYRATVMETENMAIKMATGEFFAQACVDDVHHAEYIEILSKHLHYSDDIDLVYADCLQTTSPLETFDNNSSNGNRYEHSINNFSRENMIKCLPGPMPMWKLSVHDKAGYFNEEMKYAGDWDMFLRMVDNGSKFKKIDIPLGLYYYNNDGLSTSNEYASERIKEEATVFFQYKHIFGERNFNRYKDYFQQGLQKDE